MVCVAASGAFYLQSPSTPQTTFIFMQREEIRTSCKYIIFFLYEKRKEEGIKREMSSLSLAQKETVTFTPVVVKSITFSSPAPVSTELFIQ